MTRHAYIYKHMQTRAKNTSKKKKQQEAMPEKGEKCTEQGHFERNNASLIFTIWTWASGSNDEWLSKYHHLMAMGPTNDSLKPC